MSGLLPSVTCTFESYYDRLERSLRNLWLQNSHLVSCSLKMDITLSIISLAQYLQRSYSNTVIPENILSLIVFIIFIIFIMCGISSGFNLLNHLIIYSFFLSVTRKSFLGNSPSSNSSILTISYPLAKRSTFCLLKKCTIKPPTSYMSSPR